MLKDTLAWDPMIDVVLRRIPPGSISRTRGPGRMESQIATLAAGLDENDAFVIFPEGGTLRQRRQRGSNGCASWGWSGWRAAPRR